MFLKISQNLQENTCAGVSTCQFREIHKAPQQIFAGLEDVLKTCLDDVLKTLWRQTKYLLTGDICI